ncbi:chloride channel, voltage gated [Kipferlia bialata]|uniref:Chloride channel, voltage gated n=1 Tax=Kipferlia bialata TaxID=797122 RepID=A0A9K3GHP2_9EUKA|nr:chloride channel, voltage gated [Kipferlia bialata]GIQ83067.1 chloride channel, voltage gated [Kipferlia bialata]GIQ85197.1 chloride channel, voltage gated [Kipferlia bialata]|eukprot:g4274.t1
MRVKGRVHQMSGGSGIPELITLFDMGVPTSGTAASFFSYRSIVYKALSLVWAMGSGLVVGKEGPYVYMAVALTAQLALLRPFRRHFRHKSGASSLSAAVAAGVVSTFGAVFGGTLFSVEVSRHGGGIAALLNIVWCGSFAMIVVSQLDMTTLAHMFGTGTGADSDLGDTDFDTRELPLFALLGVGLGLLGWVYIKMYPPVNAFLRGLICERRLRMRISPCPCDNSSAWRDWNRLTLYARRTLAVVVVALLTTAISFGIPGLRLPSNLLVQGLFSGSLDGSGSGITEGGEGSWERVRDLLLLSAAYAVMHLLALCLPITVGFFTPMFVLGSVLGRAVGEALNLGNAALYSVIGAGGMCGSVTQTLSSAVIVIELVGTPFIATPVLVTIVFSVLTSRSLGVSMYEQIQRVKCLPDLHTLATISLPERRRLNTFAALSGDGTGTLSQSSFHNGSTFHSMHNGVQGEGKRRDLADLFTDPRHETAGKDDGEGTGPAPDVPDTVERQTGQTGEDTEPEGLVGVDAEAVTEMLSVNALTKYPSVVSRGLRRRYIFSTSVGEVAHTNPVCLRQRSTLAEMLDVVTRHTAVVLPVVNDSMQLVGEVRRQDVYILLLTSLRRLSVSLALANYGTQQHGGESTEGVYSTGDSKTGVVYHGDSHTTRHLSESDSSSDSDQSVSTGEGQGSELGFACIVPGASPLAEDGSDEGEAETETEGESTPEATPGADKGQAEGVPQDNALRQPVPVGSKGSCRDRERERDEADRDMTRALGDTHGSHSTHPQTSSLMSDPMLAHFRRYPRRTVAATVLLLPFLTFESSVMNTVFADMALVQAPNNSVIESGAGSKGDVHTDATGIPCGVDAQEDRAEGPGHSLPSLPPRVKVPLSDGLHVIGHAPVEVHPSLPLSSDPGAMHIVSGSQGYPHLSPRPHPTVQTSGAAHGVGRRGILPRMHPAGRVNVNARGKAELLRRIVGDSRRREEPCPCHTEGGIRLTRVPYPDTVLQGMLASIPHEGHFLPFLPRSSLMFTVDLLTTPGIEPDLSPFSILSHMPVASALRLCNLLGLDNAYIRDSHGRLVGTVLQGDLADLCQAASGFGACSNRCPNGRDILMGRGCVQCPRVQSIV